jgi:hypothetical protein
MKGIEEEVENNHNIIILFLFKKIQLENQSKVIIL